MAAADLGQHRLGAVDLTPDLPKVEEEELVVGEVNEGQSHRLLVVLSPVLVCLWDRGRVRWWDGGGAGDGGRGESGGDALLCWIVWWLMVTVELSGE